MIVATAGHIDHGKTLLVRALTGTDTDRLPEEKRRGISIDIGFAYLPTPLGKLLGFVDVPGHDRFIRNMLAGVCSIDLALMVISADDGVMPQTIEHLQILDLLRVKRGIAVINKIDRVPEQRVEEVTGSVRVLLEHTSLAGCPIYPVSALTGAGIQALKEKLVAEADALPGRLVEGQLARYAIDRMFSVSGSGTVVTGTVFNGSIVAGSRLMVSPGGVQVRVRGIQINGRPVNEAGAGQRCALNLAGVDLHRKSIGRGDWVLDEALHDPTSRIDARVQVIATESEALAHMSPVHLHMGTISVPGRIAIRRGASIEPKTSGIAQIILERPICAMQGDRFVLRNASATRTIGGGSVVDPFAPATRRYTAWRLARLGALEREAPADALRALVDATPGGVDLKRFETTFGLQPAAAEALYVALQLVVLGKPERVAISLAERDRIRAAILAAIDRLHREDPKSLGVELSTLRDRLGSDLPEPAVAQLVRELAVEKQLETVGTMVRRPGHDATSNPEDDRLWQRVLPLLAIEKRLPPTVAEIASTLGLPEKLLGDLMSRKGKAGDLVRFADRRYLLRTDVLRFAQWAAQTAGANPDGHILAAEYRDTVETSRKHAIEMLEFFDRIGYTYRSGDKRRIIRTIEQSLR
jgi:selenocysteine-specific elongation factor